MNFIKPLIPRVVKNTSLQEELKKLQTDKELIDALKKYISFEEIAKEFNRYYGVKLIDIEKLGIDSYILKSFEEGKLNRETLEKHSVLPYDYDAKRNTYYFATSDFLNEGLRQSIIKSCKAIKTKADFTFAPKDSIAQQYENLKKGNTEGVRTEEKVTQKASKDNPKKETISLTEHIQEPEDFNVQDWVAEVLDKGIQYNASDIHIESLEFKLQVRYRIDGRMSLKKVYQLSDENKAAIFVRLKVISDMDITEKRKPQDGRINNYEHEEGTYDMRVSTVVTVNGEKAVIRLSNKSKGFLSYSQLGFSDEDSSKVRKILSNKNGILYIAGATGSGKTTTLYSMIDELNKDTVNMYTIEDPVEQTIPEVNQIQIDRPAGVTFPSTLKSLLRQDPDVIVVGEIRDKETAELSVQSSLTGHLVLSTVHANNALESITRLLDMGLEPYLVVGSSLAFLSQRLVRKTCPHCRVPYDGQDIRKNVWIEHMEEEHNLEIDKSKLYQAVGCDKCVEGYSGRVAVVEIIEVTPAIQELILNGAHLSEIKEQALADGFTPLVVNGISKALNGVTTIEELMKELN